MSEYWPDHDSEFHPVSAPDYLPLERLRALQLHRLQATVHHAFRNVAPYREKMAAAGINPEDIRSLADLSRLPFTVKADLRDHYPFGLFAVPLAEIVRVHASSGTTGKPIVVAYTREDLEVWTNVMMRSLAGCGCRRGDIVQNAYGYGLFTGGLGAHGGAEGLGAMVVPISGGNTDRQLMLLKDFGATFICCTPSYFIHLIERAGELGLDLRELPLKAGVFGAEPWSEAMRGYIQDRAGIEAYDIYGLSEIIGPGVGCECRERRGIHIFEDHFFPEIVDPQTLEPLPDGQEGELVLTTLTKRALPMLRYRTRDLSRLAVEACTCGRTIRRLERIGRRSDDMFIIRGVNVFPSQIETALLSVEGTLPHYQIVLTRDQGLDEIEVQVEVTPAVLADTIRGLEDLRARLGEAIERIIGIRVKLSLVEPQTIERSQGKAKRLIDKRKI